MLYEDFAEKEKSAVMATPGESSKARTHVFQALQYLKKVCNHPKLVLHPDHKQVSP